MVRLIAKAFYVTILQSLKISLNCFISFRLGKKIESHENSIPFFVKKVNFIKKKSFIKKTINFKINNSLGMLGCFVLYRNKKNSKIFYFSLIKKKFTKFLLIIHANIDNFFFSLSKIFQKEKNILLSKLKKNFKIKSRKCNENHC